MMNSIKFGELRAKTVCYVEPRRHWLETQPIITLQVDVSGSDREKYKPLICKVTDQLMIRSQNGIINISSKKGKPYTPIGSDSLRAVFEIIRNVSIPKASIDKKAPLKNESDVKFRLIESLFTTTFAQEALKVAESESQIRKLPKIQSHQFSAKRTQ